MGEVVVDLRCPRDMRELLMRLRFSGGERPRVVQPGNLLELSCIKCRRRLNRDDSYPPVVRVLHRFDFAGEWVEDEVVRGEAPAVPIHQRRVSAPD